MAGCIVKYILFFYGFAHLETKLECLFGCRSIFL